MIQFHIHKIQIYSHLINFYFQKFKDRQSNSNLNFTTVADLYPKSISTLTKSVYLYRTIYTFPHSISDLFSSDAIQCLQKLPVCIQRINVPKLQIPHICFELLPFQVRKNHRSISNLSNSIFTKPSDLYPINPILHSHEFHSFVSE